MPKPEIALRFSKTTTLLRFKNLLPFDAHRSATEYEIKLLSDYLQIAQKAVGHAEKKAKNDFDRFVAKIKDQQLREFYASQLLRHAALFREELPMRVRYGFILLLYSVFETRSRALCLEIQRRTPELRLRLADLRGSRSIQGVFIFLRKLANISIPEQHSLDQLRIIRNCIAHVNGCVDDDDSPKRVRKVVRESKGAHVDRNGYIMLKATYCSEQLRIVQKFFECSFTELRFGAGYGFSPRPAVRHGVSYETLNGKMIFKIIGERDVRKILNTRI